MTSTTSTVQELAREARGWFETARRATGDTATGPREDGEEYVRTKDGRPEWVQELCYEAHGDMLPDDWRYARIADALEAIADADDVDAAGDEYADQAVDVYTGSRLAWLASHLSRPGYCDEAADELSEVSGGIIDLVGLGQYQEAREIFGLVLHQLEERLEELDAAEAFGEND